MSLIRTFQIGASALTAQSQRLNAVASNLANAESAAPPGTPGYRARQVVFETLPARDGTASVRVAGMREDQAPARRQFDPRHPLADREGYVNMSNVNVVDQMIDMISASRAYQNNLEVMNTARTLASRTLNMGN